MRPLGIESLVRIHIGEGDRLRGRPLYELLLLLAKDAGLAGATVLRGIESFGVSGVVHRARLAELTSDLPILIEIVDVDERLKPFLDRLDELLEEAACGALVTLEAVEVRRYGRVR